MFRTAEEEAKELARELRELKEVLREISTKIARIDQRVKRAFPAVFPKAAVDHVHRVVPKLSDPPTISPREALRLYDELVSAARAGNKSEVQSQLGRMGSPDLALLCRELGVSLGKSKPSRKTLAKGIMGRISESVMLSTSGLRQRPGPPNASD